MSGEPQSGFERWKAASEPTTAEIGELQAYLGVVAEPEGGYSLAQLRSPGSTVSLQKIEKMANALVASGFLSATYVSGVRGVSHRKFNKVVKS